MKNLVSLAVALLASASAQAQDFQPPKVDGRINVGDPDMKPPFLREELFYPGEKIDLEVEYRVDAMRWMHEDRECWSKWFGGIDCHYVKKFDSSGLGSAQVPLILDLTRPDGGGAAPSVTPQLQNGSPHDPARQLPIDTMSFTLTITIPQLESIIGVGYLLQGRVAPLYGTAPDLRGLTRRACEPFRSKEHCSQGEYVVRLKKVDSSVRIDMIEKWLLKPRSAAEITSVVDEWSIFTFSDGGKVVADIANRRKIAAALLAQVTKFHPIPKGGASRPDRLEILKFARRLDAENPSISSAIVTTQIANGDILDAQTTNNEKIAELEKAYRGGSVLEPVMRGYAEALRDAGRIYLAKSFELDPADTLVAADYFKQSAQVWSKYIDKAAGGDVALGTREYVAARLDEARTSARVSDLVPLDTGIAAVRDARTRLPLVRDGLVVAVDPGGAMLVVTDQFTELAQTDGGNVPLAMLPEGTLEVLDTDALNGRVLLRERGHAGLVEISVQNAGSRSEMRRLEEAQLTRGGVTGLDGSNLIRQADGKESMVTVIAGGTLWASAREADIVVTLPNGVNPAPQLIRGGISSTLASLALDSVSKIALSRDGTLLAAEGLANGDRYIVLVDTASGMPKCTVKLQDAPASVSLMFTADGSRAVAWRPDRSIEIIDANTGLPTVLKATGADRTPMVLKDSQLLIAGGPANQPIRWVSFIDTSKISTGPANGQPPGAITEIQLKQELEAPSLVALFKAPDAAFPALAASALGNAASPVIARVNLATGARGNDITLTGWHPLRSFPIGSHIAVNPGPAGGAAQLFPPDATAAIVFPAAPGTVTRIVPAGPGSAFAVLTEHGGSITTIASYSAPEARIKSVNFDQRAGFKWKPVMVTSGPLVARQQQIMLAEIPDTPPAAAAPVRLAVMTGDGSLTTVTQQIKSPEEIAAIVGLGTAIVRRTSDKLILEMPTGNTKELADCTGKPDCTLALYQTGPAKFVIALERPNKLEINEWTIGATITVTSCKACDQLDAITAARNTANIPAGFATARFALSPGNIGTYVTIPGAKSLLVGPLGGGQLEFRAGNGMPVYGNQDRVTAQRGSQVEIWKPVI